MESSLSLLTKARVEIHPPPHHPSCQKIPYFFLLNLMMQKFCHWRFISMITWMEDNGVFPSHNAVKLYQTTNHWKALTWNWCRVICELYWLHCTIWRLEIPQCFLFFYYKKVLMIGFCPQIRKLEWMIHTVPLKSKLTVTQCLDPWDSILKSWFSILKTFEDGVSRHDDQGSSFNVRVRKYYDLLVRVHLLKVYTKLLF